MKSVLKVIVQFSPIPIKKKPDLTQIGPRQSSKASIVDKAHECLVLVLHNQNIYVSIQFKVDQTGS